MGSPRNRHGLTMCGCRYGPQSIPRLFAGHGKHGVKVCREARNSPMVFAATGGGRAPNGAVIRMHDSLAEAAFCGTGARRRGSCSGNKRSIANKSLTALAGRWEGSMPTYKAPVDDTLFLLNDVFHLDRYGNLPGFADASPDLVEAVLREAGKFCRGGADPAQPRRRQGRLHAPRRRQRDHADRLQGRLSSRSSTAAGSASRCRPSSAARACRRR